MHSWLYCYTDWLLTILCKLLLYNRDGSSIITWTRACTVIWSDGRLPVTPSVIRTTNSENLHDETYINEHTCSELELFLAQDDKFLNEYNRLIQLYRELPSGMFVSQIVRDYASSEPDLEATRLLFFGALKSYHDVPFGSEAELKRRVNTRRGETLSRKQATDIYTLVSILEDEDYNEMKNLISRSKHTNSVSQTPKPTPVRPASMYVPLTGGINNSVNF